MAVATPTKPITLPLTAEGRKLLLTLLEWAKENGYPMGPFEKETLARLRA